MDLSIPGLICRALILIIVFPAHELAHAVAATWMGDPTPRLAGRLTLNPFKHLSAFGSLLFLMAGIGWASTPINPAYFGENARRKLGLVSAVGPLTNLALALLGVIPFYLFRLQPTGAVASRYWPTPAYFLTLFVLLNLLLAVFNLIPIAPLDGAQVVGAFLSGPPLRVYDSIQRYGGYILITVVLVLPQFGFDPVGLVLDAVMWPAFQFLMSGLG
jgi:Zn-dependent protease